MAPSPRVYDLAAQVAALNAKVNIILAIGGAVLAGGSYVAYDLTTKLGDVKQSVGLIQGSVGKPLTDKLDEIIKRLPNAVVPPAQAPALEKQGLYAPTPSAIDGWMGVEAPSTDDLAKALIKTPDTKTPVWVYTNEPATAEALENALGTQ